MSNKEDIKNGYNYISRPFMHPDLIALSIAYKEAIEAVNMLYDYSKRDMTVSELEKIKEVLDKAPEDL